MLCFWILLPPLPQQDTQKSLHHMFSPAMNQWVLALQPPLTLMRWCCARGRPVLDDSLPIECIWKWRLNVGSPLILLVSGFLHALLYHPVKKHAPYFNQTILIPSITLIAPLYLLRVFPVHLHAGNGLSPKWLKLSPHNYCTGGNIIQCEAGVWVFQK